MYFLELVAESNLKTTCVPLLKILAELCCVCNTYIEAIVVKTYTNLTTNLNAICCIFATTHVVFIKEASSFVIMIS